MPSQPSGPKPGTLALADEIRRLQSRGVKRYLLPGRLGKTVKQIDHAIRVIKEQDGELTPRRYSRRKEAQLRNPVPPGTSWDWQDAAACRGMGIGLFFGHEGERQAERERREREAKAVCAGCMVREECLELALARPEKAGTWAGLNKDERAAERRKRMRTDRAREEEDVA